jgi:hypothetical protein
MLGIPSFQDNQSAQYFPIELERVHLAEFVSLDFQTL